MCTTYRAIAFGFIVLAGAAIEVLAAEPPIAPRELRSGITFAGENVRALQADDFQNPGMLWVERGARLWSAASGARDRSCAGCHGEAARATDRVDAMQGVAARYPRFDPALGRVVNLEGRINACRTGQQGAAPLRYESEDLLALTAFLAHQSRGMPIAVVIDGPARPAFDAGARLYQRRMGQVNLACANCHDALWGRRLLAERISQGHGNAYPIYRLEWQTAGSLHRRFRSCLSGVRAEMWPYGAEEYTQLELYLAWRAQGLPIETPGVRR